MALQIVEFFGRTPLDERAASDVNSRRCPFVGADCIKPNHGACSLRQIEGEPIIACPNRLYADDFRLLNEIACEVFGPASRLVNSINFSGLRRAGALTGNEVIVFGRYSGRELALPRPKMKSTAATGNYFVDWILASFDRKGELAQFTAVEAQTIDTTGSYREQSDQFFAGLPFLDKQGRQPGFSASGMNWENVNKRILPQLIYKGHVLRREVKCSKGLFFICPNQVLEKVRERLGDKLHSYPPGNGTITFRSYELNTKVTSDGIRQLKMVEQFTTTVDQIAVAFTSPMNLPSMNVYEQAILSAIKV